MKSEKLTLRASQLPNNYYGYDSLEELKSYDASVTAEYTFRNPADYDVKMTLAFSFGKQQGLPGGELIFTLSTVEYPQKIKQPWWKTFGYFMLFFGIPTIFALVSVGIIVAIIFIITSSAPQKGQ